MIKFLKFHAKLSFHALFLWVWLATASCQDQIANNTPKNTLNNASVLVDTVPPAKTDVTVRLIPRSEVGTGYLPKTRGPKYQILELTNPDSTDKTNVSLVSFTYDGFLTIEDPAFYDPQAAPRCPFEQPTFTIPAQSRCIVLFEGQELAQPSKASGFVEVFEDGISKNFIHLNAVQYLYASGPFEDPEGKAQNLASWAGSDWSYVKDVFTAPVTALDVDGSQNLYAAQSNGQNSSIYQWNGEVWSSLIANIPGTVETLYVSPSTNDLYVGGNFTNFPALGSDGAFLVKGSLQDNIWKWQGVGAETGLGATVRAVTETGAVTVVEETTFPLPLKITLNTNADVYNSRTQNPLVHIFTVTNTDPTLPLKNLKVQFSHATSLLRLTTDPTLYNNNFPLCDYQNFELKPLASCLVVTTGAAPSAPTALGQIETAVLQLWYDHLLFQAFSLNLEYVLYAGGTFTQAPQSNGKTLDTPFVAAYNGSTWGPVGDNTDFTATSVNALAVDSLGRLVVGGLFTQINDQSTPNIARWQGHDSWRNLGTGLNGEVLALTMQSIGSSNEQLLAGGRFTDVMGSSANTLWKLGSYNVAEDKWQAIGNFKTGKDSDAVHALLQGLSGNRLYIAGNFEQLIDGAGKAKATNHSARYTLDGVWMPWMTSFPLASMDGGATPPTYYALGGVDYLNNDGIYKPHIHGVGAFADRLGKDGSPGIMTSQNTSTQRGPVSSLDPWGPIFSIVSYWYKPPGGSKKLYGLVGGQFQTMGLKQQSGVDEIVPAQGLLGWQNELGETSGIPNCITSQMCFAQSGTGTDFGGGVNGPVRSLLRLAPADESLHGTFYLGGHFTLASGQTANNVAALYRDTQSALSPLSKGLTGGEVRALTLGSRVSVVPEQNAVSPLRIQIKDYTDPYGYYVDHLTRGPLYQVVTLINTSGTNLTGLNVQTDFESTQGRLMVVTDPASYNGRTPCPLDTTFSLNSKEECLVIIRGLIGALGTPSTGTLSFSYNEFLLHTSTFAQKTWVLAGGDFSSLTSLSRGDGEWQPMPLPPNEALIPDPQNSVRALTTTPLGWVLVGGFYQIQNTQTGEKTLHGAAAWGGIPATETQLGTWSRADHGVQGTPGQGIQGGTVHGLLHTGNGFYVGGQDLALRTHSGGSVATFAQFTGTIWNGPVPPQGPILSLLQLSKNSRFIYAGGDFNAVSQDTSVSYVGRWDSHANRWLALGQGNPQGSVEKLKTLTHIQGTVAKMENK